MIYIPFNSLLGIHRMTNLSKVEEIILSTPFLGYLPLLFRCALTFSAFNSLLGIRGYCNRNKIAPMLSTPFLGYSRSSSWVCIWLRNLSTPFLGYFCPPCPWPPPSRLSTPFLGYRLGNSRHSPGRGQLSTPFLGYSRARTP